MQDVAGFVLAGGRSSRMGTDKAFLELDRRTLLQRALDLLLGITDDVSIVGSRTKFAAYGVVVEDRYTDCGPLAGIHAALNASTKQLNLVLAVDLPFVTGALLHYLVEQARGTDALVTVPRIAGGYQPLCAVYRRAFAAAAQSELQQGRNKIDALFATTSVRVMEEAELQKFAFDPAMFENLNTPEDWGRIRANRR